MTGFRVGDTVAACRRLEGIDVPVVPAGTIGTVAATTVFGNPKRVHFTVADTWGTKRFRVRVRRGDVEPADVEPVDVEPSSIDVPADADRQV